MAENLLYNTSTRKAETIPEQDLDSALSSGQYAYKKGARINVIRPDGEVVSLPSDQIQDAISQGYRVEKASAQAVREYVEDQGTIKGAAKVFLGQMADEALFGVPETAYDLTADPLERAKKDALKKRHELANVAGGIAGFGGSLFYGGPIFKGAAKAGEVAGKATATALEAAGKAVPGAIAEKGAAKIVGNVAAKTAEKAAQLGTEGTVLSLPQAVTEGALGDPEDAAETVLLGAGLGAGLGVGAGLLHRPFKAIGERFSKIRSAKEKLTNGEALNVAEAEVSQAAKQDLAADRVIGGQGTLDDALLAETGSEDIAQKLKTLGGKRRSDANEIIEAYEALGLKPSEAALSDNYLVRQAEATLADSPSLVAQVYIKPVKEAFKVAQTEIERGLGAGTNLTAENIGAQIKQQLSRKVEEQRTKLGEVFSRVGASAAEIPIESGSFGSRISELMADKEIALAMKSKVSSPSATLAKKAEALAQSVKTLDDLDTAKRLLRQDVSYATLSGGERRILTKATEAFEQTYEEALEKYVRTKIPEGAARTEAEALLAERAQANEGWAQLMGEIQAIGKATGKRRVTTPGQFLDHLEETAAEKIVDRLFQSKDIRFLENFRRQNPAAFDLMAEYQRKKILDKARTAEGFTNWGSVARDVSKLNPDVARMITRDYDRLKTAQRVFETLPKPFQSNPSKTDIRREFRGFISPTENVSDAALAGAIKYSAKVDGILAVEQAQKYVAKKLDSISGALESFDRKTSSHTVGLDALRRMFPDAKNKEEAFNELRSNLEYAAVHGIDAKPAKGMSSLEVATNLSEGGAPTVAQIYRERVTEAAKYLYETMPQPLVPENPINPRKWKPSVVQMNDFERRLGVVLDPFVTIDALRDNSLTRSQVETADILYPKLMNRIRQVTLQSLLDKPKTLSYQKRLKLSLLMGMEFDSSLQDMSAYQASFTPAGQARVDAAMGNTMKPVPQMENVHMAQRFEEGQLGEDA